MTGTGHREILPVEVIFSCSICHSTLREIYENAELDKGFRDGNDSEQQNEQLVTKLWLVECSHLVCGKHLEGGGELDISNRAKTECES